MSTRALAVTERAVMPFGKFRGEALEELPAKYLLWVWELPNLRDPLKSSIMAEIARRVLLSPTVWEVPAEAPVAELHVGDVDQDGERLPF